MTVPSCFLSMYLFQPFWIVLKKKYSLVCEVGSFSEGKVLDILSSFCSVHYYHTMALCCILVPLCPCSCFATCHVMVMVGRVELTWLKVTWWRAVASTSQHSSCVGQLGRAPRCCPPTPLLPLPWSYSCSFEHFRGHHAPRCPHRWPVLIFILNFLSLNPCIWWIWKCHALLTDVDNTAESNFLCGVFILCQ